MQKRQRKKRKKGKNILPTIIIVLFFLLVTVAIGSYFYIQSLNKRVKKFDNEENYTLNIVVDDELLSELIAEPLYKYETVYIPFNIVNVYLDEFLYWDESMNKIIYTKLDTNENNDVSITFNEGEDFYYKNGEKIAFNAPVIYENDYPFISEHILKEFYDVEIFYDNNIVDLHTYKTDIGIINGSVFSYLKYNPNKDSDFLLKLEKNEEVYKYDIHKTDETYMKIKTKGGIIGYIEADKVEEFMTFDKVEEKEVQLERREEPVVLLWDQVTTKQANSNANRRVTHEGLNVLSPTWFSFDENKLDGTIISLADKDYVKFAHNNGYEVWGLITDIPSGNVSNVGNIANQVITNTEQRHFAIEQIMDLIEQYNLDGINLDFEYVRATDIDDYIQFTRELYMEMKKDGYILSVDTYVPSAWSMYYNRKALAESSDYIIVMTYDEHTNPNESIGPVASIDFVDKGVADTLNEVPKEKLIMGIPFYTRVWRTEYSGDEIKKSLRNYGMTTAVDFFEANNAIIDWDDKTGYYYSEFRTTENGNDVYYQAWLETTETIEKKLEIYKKYDLEGIAMWKRGLEDSDVWEKISEAK